MGRNARKRISYGKCRLCMRPRDKLELELELTWARSAATGQLGGRPQAGSQWLGRRPPELNPLLGRP